MKFYINKFLIKANFFLLIIFSFSAIVFSADDLMAQKKNADENEMCWWYEKPATKYWEGLPIATGRFAAMIIGQINEDQIWLNDETLWAGSPNNPNEPNGPKVLAEMRELIFKGKYAEADSVSFNFSSRPNRVQHYQPMSNLHLKFLNQDETKAVNYKRKLSMDSALVTITYQIDGVNYKREVFASYPDQVIVMRLTADKPGKISFTGWMSSLQPSGVSFVENNDLVMNGGTTELSHELYAKRVIPSLMKWQSRVRIINEGGSITASKADVEKNSEAIKVDNADAVTIIIAGATNWKNWSDISANEKERCDEYINKAAVKKYSVLRNAHISDYCPLFSACKIDLGGYEKNKINTTQRMDDLRAGGTDPLFIAQYFQFGRYLLFAGARENTLAFNNHNIWLNNMEGRWQGRWTLNINIQECYWPVDNTNMSILNESLVYFTEQLAQAGARTAKEMYNCRGWVAHHGTDIWFNTAPTDPNPKAAKWPMGGAWLLQQLYDHYEYNLDLNYLKRIYPLMKGSVEFFLDFLIQDPKTGYLVTVPSTSPENFFMYDGKRGQLSIASSMDNQLIRNLFQNSINACKVLNVDKELQSKMEEVLTKIPPHQIGKYGQLQEWFYDYDEFDVQHRHLSHLFAFYPDDDITIHKTPDLAKSVVRVLERKGDIRLGWSGAWKINLFARIGDAEGAKHILDKMVTEVSLHPREEDSRITPSYEGNQAIQGVTAGITEMLMQSHSNEISILPALPSSWQKGSIKGIKARGGYIMDIIWENGKLKESIINSKFAGKCKIRTKEPVKIYSQNKLVSTANLCNNVLEFDAKAGATYKIVPQNK